MLTKLIFTLLLPSLAFISPETPQIKGINIVQSSQWRKTNEYAIEPIISAPSAVAMDADSEQILFKKNINEIRPVASLTKLATVLIYLTKTNNDMDKEIIFQKNDERNGGKRNIYRGEAAKASDFIHTALMASDNSAAAALAREGNFLQTFSEEADYIFQMLGLQQTHFIEPTGLSSENISTALEIGKIAQNLFKNQKIAKIASKKIYTFSILNNNRKQKIISTNNLLNNQFFKIEAGKTGFISDSGYNLIIQAKNQAEKQIIIVILGALTSEDRFQDAKTLAWWIFENFQ